MTGHDFLSLASQLAAGSTEADWRTAAGRVYYAAFHVARQMLEGLKFRVPRAEQAHRHLWLRLSNCGDPQVQQTGADLNELRRYRNRADYELNHFFRQAEAYSQVRAAEQVIQVLDNLSPAVRTQITDVMKVYERDVLRDVTWQP
jgi:uncharacterized protein (UPF0332 family)